MRLKTIVALTDFSAQAEQCLDRAALLARVHQAELRILYGAEVPSPKFSDPYARLEQRGRQLARRHGITAVAVSGSGDLLADALAQTRDADLLVLDRRTHRTWHSFWCGSTIEQVIHRATCPVLVVQQPATGAYAQLLVAVDFSEVSRSLVRYASGFETGAAMELFHAMDVRNKTRLRCADAKASVVHAYRRLALKNAENRSFRFADSFDARRNRVETLMGRGDPVVQITVQKQASNADLVVVGKSRPHAVVDWLMGSMARGLVAGLDCDVLVVPHDYHTAGSAGPSKAGSPMGPGAMA